MQKRQAVIILFIVIIVSLIAAIQPATAKVGPDALILCKDLAFSIEEDFVTQGPMPPDGNPIISDGDLLGPNCTICARNADLLHTFFDVDEDLGLDAVHVVDSDPEVYLVAFSTELDSPNRGQFTAGDLLITNVGIIPNVALLAAFNAVRGDLGLDAVQFLGKAEDIRRFLDFAKTVSRQDWVNDPGKLAEILAHYEIDILFSTEGTGPDTTSPLFLDGDFLSARFGVIVHSNGALLPNSVPAGIPVRGVDFGLDAGNMVPPNQPEVVNFSTSILFNGEPAFTDGDLLLMGDGVVIPNEDLINCFEPKADFLGLDAFFSTEGYRSVAILMAQIEASAHAKKKAAPTGSATAVESAAKDLNHLRLEACRAWAFSTEEDFVTRGPEPPDGNPIISDGDLLGRNCVVCARNAELLANFDITTDLGLDAVDVISVEAAYVAFSTELDSPHNSSTAIHFTAGDLLATNGAIIPNLALMRKFNITYDLGLDALLFVGTPEQIFAFIENAAQWSRDDWINDPDALAGMLADHEVDIWFSTEGTGPLPTAPVLLDGDLLSAANGTIVLSNDLLLPPEIPAGIPVRGVDFGLDAATGSRDGRREMINFSTEILYRGDVPFTDGDLLKQGGGLLFSNEELVGCFEPAARFLGLDAIHRACIPRLEWTWNSTSVEPDFIQVMMAPVVADLNADGVPDIIFSTFDASAGWTAGGILRAISGDGSSELFSVTDPAYRVQAGAEPAVADIDNDGRPEIMVSKQTGEIICFEHDGAFKWATTGYYTPGRIGIAVADLDHDGSPEIISGKTVLNNDGTLWWSGTGGSNYLSLVADLDLDGSPEVVVGSTAYRYDGTIYWSGAPSGKPAVGNFDNDPYPEIVLVGTDEINMKEHDGTLKWGPVAFPGGGSGPPVVADLDGDGELEIGVGGYDYFIAMETDGSIKWMADIRDYSSRAAGASAFDFDGDGSFEIVYSDELVHRIFRGSNGAVLFEAPGRSGTLIEQPIIADVDNDGHVEIVFAVNNYAGPAYNTGIEVYGVDECWPDARKIWNQHTYHITNINDDATVPAFETDNWSLYNNYRTQAPAVPVIEKIEYDPCISEHPNCPDANISVTAFDPAGGTLTYAYTVTPNLGTILGTGANVAYDPPDTGPHPCPYRVTVTVTSSATGLSSARTIGITVKLTGDVDGSGSVNALDRIYVRNAFGSVPGDPNWDPGADVDCSGSVNALDRIYVRNQFGASGCACP